MFRRFLIRLRFVLNARERGGRGRIIGASLGLGVVVIFEVAIQVGVPTLAALLLLWAIATVLITWRVWRVRGRMPSDSRSQGT